MVTVTNHHALQKKLVVKGERNHHLFMGKGAKKERARKKKITKERMNEARNNLKSYALSYSSRHMTLQLNELCICFYIS